MKRLEHMVRIVRQSTTGDQEGSIHSIVFDDFEMPSWMRQE